MTPSFFLRYTRHRDWPCLFVAVTVYFLFIKRNYITNRQCYRWSDEKYVCKNVLYLLIIHHTGARMLVYQWGADIKEYMYIRTMNRNVSLHRSGNEERRKNRTSLMNGKWSLLLFYYVSWRKKEKGVYLYENA